MRDDDTAAIPLGPPMLLSDLADIGVDAVEVWCVAPGCYHHASLPAAELIARLGADCRVVDVARHCRCRACGSREVTSRPDWSRYGPGVVTRHT